MEAHQFFPCKDTGLRISVLWTRATIEGVNPFYDRGGRSPSTIEGVDPFYDRGGRPLLR